MSRRFLLISGKQSGCSFCWSPRLLWATLVRVRNLLRSDVQQELAGIIVLLTMMAHGLALLVPSLWLFIQWRWDGVWLLQWQDFVFGPMLIVLPAAMFWFSD